MYNSKLTSKDNDPLVRQKAKDDFEAKAAARSSAMQMNLANLTAIRSSLATEAKNHPAAAPEELKRIDDAIYLQQQQISAFDQAKAGSNAFYQELIQREGKVNAPESSTNKPANAGLGSAPVYLHPSDSYSTTMTTTRTAQTNIKMGGKPLATPQDWAASYKTPSLESLEKDVPVSNSNSKDDFARAFKKEAEATQVAKDVGSIKKLLIKNINQ